jgi:predicted membrane chloride channel (bestrophin family)
VTYGFGFMIESLVAVLLMLTIAYCVILNSRLKRLKADEQSLKATIAELITATEIAERAVAGLKTTAHECDHTLGERLRTADRCCAELNQQIKSGDVLLKRLSRIVAAARPNEGDCEPAVAPDPKAVAAAAQAFAERARIRLGSLAA